MQERVKLLQDVLKEENVGEKEGDREGWGWEREGERGRVG
jgi:hypothetical protein